MAFRPFAAKGSIKKLGALCYELLILLGEGEAPGSSEQSIPFSCGEVAGKFQGTDLCRPRGWAAPAILPRLFLSHLLHVPENHLIAS